MMLPCSIGAAWLASCPAAATELPRPAPAQVLRTHLLPLTNCAFNKSGDRFITGSYDRTCRVWDTTSGEELLVLEGHKNVVSAAGLMLL